MEEIQGKIAKEFKEIGERLLAPITWETDLVLTPKQLFNKQRWERYYGALQHVEESNFHKMKDILISHLNEYAEVTEKKENMIYIMIVEEEE